MDFELGSSSPASPSVFQPPLHSAPRIPSTIPTLPPLSSVGPHSPTASFPSDQDALLAITKLARTPSYRTSLIPLYIIRNALNLNIMVSATYVKLLRLLQSLVVRRILEYSSLHGREYFNLTPTHRTSLRQLRAPSEEQLSA